MRVVIVDDHPITRQGLRAAFAVTEDVEVVGEASTGEQAVILVDELLPDVVFMDIRMPGMSGLEATRAIREQHPEVKVIVFRVAESRASVAEALRAGVAGYMLKDGAAD